ncbi:MAG: hypothetical protein ACK5AL_16765 [Planctomycetota bacterium]|jgi:hypothetical protein
MPRSLPAAALAAAVLFAACTSPPAPLPPLALGASFDVRHEGRVGPLAPLTREAADATSALAQMQQPVVATAGEAAGASAGTASVRVWLVELPVDDPTARALAAGGNAAPGQLLQTRGALVAPAALAERIDAWGHRAHIVSSPFLVTKLDQRASLRISQQRAAVSSLRVQAKAGAVTVDPHVDTYEHGTHIDVRVRREDDGAVAAIAWSMVDMNEPRTVAAIDRGAFGSLEVPIALQQTTTAETKLPAHGAFLLGPVPTTNLRFVQALAVEIDAR